MYEDSSELHYTTVGCLRKISQYISTRRNRVL